MHEPQQRPHPTHSGSVRWKVLLLTSLGIFGQFYAFDNPSALNQQLKHHMQIKTQSLEPEFDYYFNGLYTAYSLPNLVLPLIMGLAVDRWGWGLLICSLGACVILGNIVFSTGVGLGSWSTMILGRIIFGFGGESMQVAQNCLLFHWFKGGELAFALAVNLSVARSGSALNDLLSPWVASRCGVLGAVWLGTLLCLGSYVCNLLSVEVDRREGNKIAAQRSSDVDAEEPISFRQILRMPRMFWLLVAFSVVMYCAIMPFNNVASAFFVETTFAHLTLADAQQRAGEAMSLMFLIVALGMAPFGALVDFAGCRAHFLLFSALLVPLTYSVVFMVPPVATMINLGITYSVFAGVWWPTLALTVPKQQLGTAYGVATALQNGGLATIPLLIGHMQESAGQGNYNGIMQLLMRFGLVAVLFALWILRENALGTKVLSIPSKMIQPVAETRDETQAIDETSSLLDSSASATRREGSVFTEP